MRKFVFPTTVLFASMLLLAGCHQTPQNGVVATVNGHAIQREEVDKLYTAQLANNPQQSASDDQADATRLQILQALIDETQQRVSGTVRLKLYKGLASVVGRKSPNSLYRLDYVTFGADQVYSQKDAEGFIKLNALRLRLGTISERGGS